MTDFPQEQSVRASATDQGLHVFADGCFEPNSRQGGWAFIAYRHDVELASDFGGVQNSANNATELIAVLKAATWINSHARGEPAIIWSDSVYAVKGCNSWRHIWKNNGWKKIGANTKARSRSIANRELWKSVDLQLSQNQLVSIAWCKGHSGIDGNERADELAEHGRLSMQHLFHERCPTETSAAAMVS
ncbi:ribonuclease HI [Pararhizobium sp. BT-229]|uniref:ribonuclease H family protein n=1 Tax=Pararhizobium sp. BT-229 TaxID=2986923 RepID=UPI0021F7CF8D|nr:ribonuclease H [Pararhizobium sp. BT-229]MCV9961875.1 ribonuclease HI [Pararhizobium sp. BT-229]